METLTANALSALHALSHRVALTPGELQAIKEHGSSLSPEFWDETMRMLEMADAAGEGSSIDLGFSSLVHRWLGLSDEEECIEHHGLRVGDALSQDCGRLSTLARIVEGQQPTDTKECTEARALVIQTWCDRANRLSTNRGPETADALIGALERILHACPPGEASTEHLRTEFVRLCEEAGDPDRAARARQQSESIAAEPETRITINPGAALALTVLWCITHGEMLLLSEHDFDPDIERSPEEWKRIRVAVLDGCTSEVPVPIATAKAWCTGEGLDESELRACLEQDVTGLAVTLLAVECLWGGHEDDGVPAEALRQALAIARVRRARMERDYCPPEGERQNIWYEVHQGVRRSETMERVALIHRLNDVLERYGHIDPSAFGCVHLDRAAEAESRGRHEQTRAHLQETRRLLHSAEDPEQAAYGHVCLAQHAWASGEAARALAMLAELDGNQARELGRRIENREEERRKLLHAERVHRRRADLESWCAVAHAHMAAEHTIAAERCARRICREYPARPHAWEALARVLHENGRHRDAVDPARMAVSLSAHEPVRAALLARILSRFGPR